MTIGLATLCIETGPRASLAVPGGYLLADHGETVLGWLQDWDRAEERLLELAEGPIDRHRWIPAEDATVLTPVRYPGNLITVRGNHAEGPMRTRSVDGAAFPVPFFLRPAETTLVDVGSCLGLPRSAGRLGWGCHLAVVLGRELRYATAAAARRAIAGYTVALTLSRDLDHQALCGPVVTHRSGMPDPDSAPITVTQDGRTLLSGSTGHLVHQVDELLAGLSRHLPLHPGDIVFTGSPRGDRPTTDGPRPPTGRLEARVGNLPTLRVAVGAYRSTRGGATLRTATSIAALPAPPDLITQP